MLYLFSFSQNTRENINFSGSIFPAYVLLCDCKIFLKIVVIIEHLSVGHTQISIFICESRKSVKKCIILTVKGVPLIMAQISYYYIWIAQRNPSKKRDHCAPSIKLRPRLMGVGNYLNHQRKPGIMSSEPPRVVGYGDLLISPWTDTGSHSSHTGPVLLEIL